VILIAGCAGEAARLPGYEPMGGGGSTRATASRRPNPPAVSLVASPREAYADGDRPRAPDPAAAQAPILPEAPTR
jgi:hypothetical protein